MRKKTKMNRILPALIVVLAAVAVMNQYIIMTQPTGFAAKPLNLVDYSETGYQQLLRYDSSIRLNGNQVSNYNGLDVELPCCGFRELGAQNCGCGHHIALSGLAKKMASEGYDRNQIQAEIDVWKEVFYPNGAPGVGSGARGSC